MSTLYFQMFMNVVKWSLAVQGLFSTIYTQVTVVADAAYEYIKK